MAELKKVEALIAETRARLETIAALDFSEENFDENLLLSTRLDKLLQIEKIETQREEIDKKIAQNQVNAEQTAKELRQLEDKNKQLEAQNKTVEAAIYSLYDAISDAQKIDTQYQLPQGYLIDKAPQDIRDSFKESVMITGLVRVSKLKNKHACYDREIRIQQQTAAELVELQQQRAAIKYI